jgi:tRNA pseudouridine55 synthase
LARVQQLAEQQEIDQLKELLLPVDSGLVGMPTIELPETSSYYLRQGQAVLASHAPTSGFVRIVEQDTREFLGVGEMLDDGRLAPRRLMVASQPLIAAHL